MQTTVSINDNSIPTWNDKAGKRKCHVKRDLRKKFEFTLPIAISKQVDAINAVFVVNSKVKPLTVSNTMVHRQYYNAIHYYNNILLHV